MTQNSKRRQTKSVAQESLKNQTPGDDQHIEPQNVTVEVVYDELTIEEQQERLRLERVIERSFYEAGKALKELRDRRLYRSTHKSFEQYCKDRFGYNTRRQPYLLIEAAAIVDNLSEKCDPLDRILPTNERQVRPLTKLDPEEQWEAWQRSVEAAGKKVPSARIVKDIVEQIMERTKVPNPYQISEVCQILPKDNPELRGKGKSWCIVTEVNNFSCTVRAWDGEYVVKMDHLKSFDYLEEDCQQMGVLCDRLTRLRNQGNLEEAALSVLKQLGEIKRPYLTPVEEKLLGVLEREYGVG
ncbi:hypothetical protein F7734_04685 [Scytonema sp. UIC 10036]|uniref:hypothetical protein n=1 Tax=Scytonema sp. UIC 10036 TaxID=2304196 RepID=UPI0012DADEEA|nr:hypothetical protein [Scytonema sp. UIC 10036]MUG91804.1 hypothetical protein [Scytonema sp. UIC 10036]